MTDATEIIERAIYAALGCTDVRKVCDFPEASKQIAAFVLAGLDDEGLCVAFKGARKILFNPIGQTFGRLKVVRELPRLPNRNGTPIRQWECQCECGNIARVRHPQISGKHTIQSCGCLHKQTLADRSRKHGFAKRGSIVPEYPIWTGMKRRCLSQKDPEFHNYGGRGITVCEIWKKSFAAFYADMGPRPSPQHSIDRINNDGNYEPGNCRWATAKEQRANQRRRAA